MDEAVFSKEKVLTSFLMFIAPIWTISDNFFLLHGTCPKYQCVLNIVLIFPIVLLFLLKVVPCPECAESDAHNAETHFPRNGAGWVDHDHLNWEQERCEYGHEIGNQTEDGCISKSKLTSLWGSVPHHRITIWEPVKTDFNSYSQLKV